MGCQQERKIILKCSHANNLIVQIMLLQLVFCVFTSSTWAVGSMRAGMVLLNYSPSAQHTA